MSGFGRFSLALLVLTIGCSRAKTTFPVEAEEQGKRSKIIWGEPVGGVRIGIPRFRNSLPAVDRSIDFTVPISIYIQNESLALPKETDGTVRMAIWRWQIGKIDPGTAGGMGVNKKPIDPAEFPLRQKLLDGKVHLLDSFFLPGPSIFPQESISGSLTITLYHTDAEGKYLGKKWHARLRTGDAPIRYEYELDNSSEEEGPELKGRP